MRKVKKKEKVILSFKIRISRVDKNIVQSKMGEDICRNQIQYEKDNKRLLHTCKTETHKKAEITTERTLSLVSTDNLSVSNFNRYTKKIFVETERIYRVSFLQKYLSNLVIFVFYFGLA